MKLKYLVLFGEEKKLGIVYIYLRQEVEGGHIIRKGYFYFIFLNNFFIHITSQSPPSLSQIPSPTTLSPFPQRRGCPPLGLPPHPGMSSLSRTK